MAAWSPADLKMLRDLARGGVGVDAICTRLSRSRSSVKIRLIREGLSLGNPRLPINSREIAIVRDMAASGHGVQTIAKAITRAVCTVRAAAAKNGIEIQSPKGGCEISFTVEQGVLLRIRRAAATRNLTATALVARLVARVAVDDLFAAVIDGGENYNSRASSRETVRV
jgi:hypothetical protein